MSVVVRCTITVGEQKYEGNARDMRIFESVGSMTSTGIFSRFTKTTLDDWVDAAVDSAKKDAHEKLSVLKGDER